MRILLVEDEALQARMLKDWLSRETDPPFDVVVSHNAGEAELELISGRFDLIMLDLNLPDSQGLDTLRRIQKVAHQTPFLILTGLDSDDLARSAIQQGAQDFLVKGEKPPVVIRAVHHAIERARTQQRLIEAERSLKRAQLQLIQAEKMESVGRLAAGIAHEVKNPLAIMQMGIDRFSAKLPQDMTELHATLADMQYAVERAYSIINRLLSFSSPTDMERKPGDLHDVLRSSLRLVHHLVAEKRATIRCEFAEGLPPVFIDAKSLEHVFINVLTNALHVTPIGGEVALRTSGRTLAQVGNGVGRRASDTFSVGARVVVCEIDDQGTGIPDDVLPRIFDPFFTTKPQGQGTGLGLCVAKNIMEFHGGRIELRNRSEGGVRASVTLLA